ncbi:MAG: TonB-dependent receptor [Bacteroidetes bacterium]|nr:TonB-dependent receptor [Fibrella sp.]
MKKCVQANRLLLRATRLICTQVVLALALVGVTYGFDGSGMADITVSGIVTDEKGEGVPGVSIVVKGSTRGTNTDQKGSFQISVPSENTVLVFSFVGYEPQEAVVGNRISLAIRMKTDQKSLNEVIVVGYGTQRKKDLTGSVASVGATEIKNVVANNGLTAIAGLVAGVQITQGNGRPGANPVVRIRGNGSFNASNTPLIVVDGMPLNNADDFNLINPADIESMDILKDAASAAIYGSRGGNGVIIVTTKKGKAGKPKITLDYYTGVQQVSKYIDLLHRDDDITYIKETTNQEWIRAGGNPATPNGSRSILGNANNSRFNYPAILDNPANLPDTDWQREIFQTAPINNYQISAQGGTDKLVYYVSGNYFQQAGVVKTTNYDRYSVRANVEASVSNRIKVGVSLSPSYAKEKLIPTDGHFNDGIINQALLMPPWIAPRTADGYYGQIAGYPDLIANGFPATPTSPVQFFYEPNYKNVSESARLLGSNFVEFQLIDGLSFRTNFNYDWRTQWLNYYRPSTIALSSSPVLTPAYPKGNLANIDSRHEERRGLNYVWENIVSYNKTFAQNHRIAALAGYTVQKFTEESARLTGQSGTYSNDQIQYVTAASVVNATADKQQWSLLSYLARVNYGYKDKYLITAAIRRDGSSRFATNNKWAVFPSVSAAWLISEEPFLRNNRIFSTVKVRGSYGVTGNFNIGNYTSLGLLAKDNYVFGNGTGMLTNGLAPGNLANRSLSWETNRQTDFGLDIGLLSERIQVNLDWYDRKTENLLYARPVPAITGFSSYLGNIGDIRNHGIELNINGRVLTSPVKLSLGGNLTANRNEVLRLGETNAPVYVNIPSGTVKTEVGKPFGQFFGYEVVGVFNTQDAALAGPQWATGGSMAGDLKFRDVNGDNRINADDRVSLGNSQANFIFGFNGKLSYKNFDLDFIFQGSQGNQTLSLTHRFIGVNTAIYNAYAFTNNRWKSPTEPGDGMIQRVYTNSQNTGGNTQLNSNWVYDASYLRLRNLTIGYNLPSALLSKVKMSSSRFYVSAQNLFTLTKYIGYNPEVSNVDGGESPAVAGIDYGTYPLARTFTFGINLGF